MSIQFREATEEDYREVARLTGDAYVSAGYFPSVDHPYVQQMRDIARRARSTVIWIAEIEGVPVAATSLVRSGSAYADVARDGELEFRMLAVDPQRQGQGIGREMVASILDYARQQPEVNSVVLTSGQDMLPAHRLYEAMGFHRVPERDWQGTDDQTGKAINLLVFEHQL